MTDRPEDKPVRTERDLKERGWCTACRLWNLTSTATPGIVRVQCARTISFLGKKHGRTCVEFPRFPGMTDADVTCGRFKPNTRFSLFLKKIFK